MHTRLVTVVLLAIFAVPLTTIAGNDPATEATRLFAQRFQEGRIKGTGHLFGIIIDCDSERLKSFSTVLSKNESKVVEYDFTFVQNARHKSKARIDGSNLSPAVTQCIIDRYYKEVTFAPGPWVPEEIPAFVRFPVVIAAGRRPMAPVTPIGVVTEE